MKKLRVFIPQGDPKFPTLKPNRRNFNRQNIFFTLLPLVEVWKFAGDNSKGFSPINVPNYPVDFLV